MNKQEALIKVEHLKKYFPAGRKNYLRAVDDVSFQIAPGRTLGLVGESGCGKTTVGRSILRLHGAIDGSVVFDGIDVGAADKKTYRQLTRRMQIIFQDPYASLNPRFTVRDIIAEGMKIHKLYTEKEAMNQRVYELLEMVGLNREHADRFPHEFSGGQRQRVGIARALAVNPEFIVCDEAISALDVSVQAQIINLLERLQKELNLTYLFIAHNLAVVRHISDETAVMYAGNIVEMGNTEAIYDEPLHPYTQGLLDAALTADPDYEQARERSTLKGEVRPADMNFTGCNFCHRCPISGNQCMTEKPVLKECAPGHWVACHQVKQDRI